MTTNEARQLLRRRRGPVVQIDVEVSGGDQSDPSTGIERVDLRRALAHLSPEDGALLVMHYALDLGSNELGTAIGTSPPAARMRRPRIVDRLRKELRSMAERDRFEVDLAAALRVYLEGAPTRGAASRAGPALRGGASPQAKQRSARGASAAVPRLAWLVLPLAALLAALVGGTLLVGSQMQRRLPAVLPFSARCSSVHPGRRRTRRGQPTRPGRPRPLHLSMAFDRRAGRLVALVGVDDAVETWTFDVCTNTWMRMHPDQEPFGLGGARVRRRLRPDDRGSGTARSCVPDPHGVAWAYSLQAKTLEQDGCNADRGD